VMPKLATKTRRIAVLARTTPETRAMLEAAATASGRSLSGEIEYRIQRSFDHEAMLDALRLVLDERRILHSDIGPDHPSTFSLTQEGVSPQ
jgi:uncharacterized protein (DUF1778 family)